MDRTFPSEGTLNPIIAFAAHCNAIEVVSIEMNKILENISREYAKNVLLVSYYFPPTGGGGVQRNLKYCKYLPMNGWRPVVLTVKDISYYSYDHNLLAELPSECRVERSGSLDPLRLSLLLRRLLRTVRRSENREGIAVAPIKEQSMVTKLYRLVRDYVLLPDGQAGWIPFAVVKGVMAVRKYKCSIVLGSVGPVSSALVTFLISRICNIPFMLDFRDGWTDDPFLKAPTKFHKKIHSVLESYIVTKSAAVGVFGAPLDAQLAAKYPVLRDKIHILPNGFDPDDFSLSPGVTVLEKAKRIRLTWTGSLYQSVHHDTFVTFLKALQQLQDAQRKEIEVIIVGNVYAELRLLVKSMELDDIIIFIGLATHAQSLAYLQSSSVALMMLAKKDYGSISGKIFEYLNAGIPILALIEADGTCADILRETGRDEFMCAPDGVDEIQETIQRLLSQTLIAPSMTSIQRFSRRENTRRLSEIFVSVTGNDNE